MFFTSEKNSPRTSKFLIAQILLKTTAQLGSIGGNNQPDQISCNQAIHTNSQLIQAVYNIAYPSNILL